MYTFIYVCMCVLYIFCICEVYIFRCVYFSIGLTLTSTLTEEEPAPFWADRIQDGSSVEETYCTVPVMPLSLLSA